MDSIKKFAEQKSSGKDMYFAVFVDDKKYAKFPKNPITALDFPEEQAKHIVAIYFRNSANKTWEFTTYLQPDSWQNIAVSDYMKQ